MDGYKQLDTMAGGNGTAVARARDSEVVAAALAAVEGSPEREARIAGLRERYRTGTYYVNHSTLAARIIEHHIVKGK